VKTGCRVVGLETDGCNVLCAVTQDGNIHGADTFVSNVSPYLLHSRILDTKSRSRRWQRRLGNLSPSVSSVVVYLGMKEGSLDRMKHSTLFWAESPDNGTVYRNITGNRKERLDHLILLKNALRPACPTLTLMHFSLKSFSSDWRSDKARLAEKMVDMAEKMLPGLRRDIVMMETGSPDTFERYTGNTGGAIYGFENIKTIYGEAKMPISTHLGNLYQVGHWGRPGCGIWNVMINGYTASHQIMKELEKR
jgi:phytoene dehydrogenase-like protein